LALALDRPKPRPDRVFLAGAGAVFGVGDEKLRSNKSSVTTCTSADAEAAVPVDALAGSSLL